MDELMLMEYLKNKGIGKNMSEHELIKKFRDFMSKTGRDNYMRHHGADMYPDSYDYDKFYMRRHNDSQGSLDKMFYSDRGNHRLFDKFNRMSEGMDEDNIYEVMKTREGSNEHFNESYAKYIVAGMYHKENGRKHVGEKFDMAKAKEVCERYRGIIPQSVTHADVYVAINSQYHDYSELFKSWFGDGIDQKIIESAIIFWFKDADYKDGFKLWKYFEED